MTQQIRLVVPEARTVQVEHTRSQRELNLDSLRIGILGNNNGNADHLLRFIVDGLQAALPVKSVIALRKPAPSAGATMEVLDQLAADADFVVSAMAD